jgi:hydroxyacylglutathione hydrolase
LYGAVGRTDLVSAADTVPLAKAQYQTAQFFRSRLDPDTELYPTHGFGSFCAAMDSELVTVSTLKQQITTNPAYIAKDEASFVDTLLNDLDDHPAYYAYMASANLGGPKAPNLDPPAKLTKAAVMSAIHSGVAVIDMRSRTAYAAGHVSGTYNIELDDSLATYVGWLIAWETPLILVAASKEEVNTAQERLSLIGREVTGGQVTPKALITDEASSYPTHTFADLAKELPNDAVSLLDVRRNSEWQKRHIPNALHIPIHELSSRIDEIDTTKELWIYCTNGYRASMAASMLSTRVKHIVLVNDDFKNATKANLIPIERKRFVDEVISGIAQLVDVRDNTEWQTEHADGAIHMQLGQILEGDTSPLDPEKTVYLYCDTGERSGMAENFLCGMGFQAINIGGLTDWVQGGGTAIH